mgnify:FL=1
MLMHKKSTSLLSVSVLALLGIFQWNVGFDSIGWCVMRIWSKSPQSIPLFKCPSKTSLLLLWHWHFGRYRGYICQKYYNNTWKIGIITTIQSIYVSKSVVICICCITIYRLCQPIEREGMQVMNESWCERFPLS